MAFLEEQQPQQQPAQPMAQGTLQGDMANMPPDPHTLTIGSPGQQLQYDDLVGRVLQIMTDQREPAAETKAKSPAEHFINMMNRDQVPMEQAIGQAVSSLMEMVYANGKRQGYEYDPEVLMAGADELARAGFLIAKHSGVMKDPPQSVEDGAESEESFMSQMPDNENPELDKQLAETDFASYVEQDTGEGDGFDYEFSMDELEFIEGAKMETGKMFGEYLLRSGELDMGSWQQLAEQYVDSEYQSGMLDEEQDFPLDQGQVDQIMQIQPAGSMELQE